MEKLIESGYEMVEEGITKENLGNFEIFDDRRKIRQTQVQSLLASLRAGKHFETPMVINRIGRKNKIIDGNHRYEALGLFFAESPDVTVMMNMAIYKNLTPAEERQVYTIWSLGIKQNIDDLLSLRKEEIPIYKYLLKHEFPVCIYRTSGTNSVSLKMIIQMLYGTYNATDTFTDMYPKRTSIVEVAKSYDRKQADLVVNFFYMFRDVFGNYNNNIYLKPVFIVPLFNVYTINGRMPFQELKRRFMKIVGDNETILRLREHSRDSRLLMRERILFLCNKGSRLKMYQ